MPALQTFIHEWIHRLCLHFSSNVSPNDRTVTANTGSTYKCNAKSIQCHSWICVLDSIWVDGNIVDEVCDVTGIGIKMDLIPTDGSPLFTMDICLLPSKSNQWGLKCNNSQVERVIWWCCVYDYRQQKCWNVYTVCRPRKYMSRIRTGIFIIVWNVCILS